MVKLSSKVRYHRASFSYDTLLCETDAQRVLFTITAIITYTNLGLTRYCLNVSSKTDPLTR